MTGGHIEVSLFMDFMMITYMKKGVEHLSNVEFE
jgi:hypothetical protein